ncbi:MAG TPA: aromatic ring-hydroxylating dioxygenase subunit alpha [Yinghuangia sp.]|uniref:aromatic ring-hydroxylating oxygenase subunit alpha n=1 Tax=Yinghuangia sp. YIM S10712 TaxID=3436930 RepID=UPI002C6AC640|nr:aromatic ring-hydroxylating dioxygenase subunit alpha [Yinghuangia sp.]
MDREALDLSLARRLVDHIENGTTDLADSVYEMSTDAYSAAHLAEELEVLFLGQPLVLGLSGDLPNPETYRTVDLCGTPVLLTRDREGRVRALLNACRHRGVRVADGVGRGKRVTCPFHAWSYELDGRLAAMPVSDAFEGMCRDDKGLVELPVDEGHGLIVGRLRPGPPVDVDAYLGPELRDELALLDFADWERLGEPHTHRVGANWKVTLDTFRENYHFDFLHRRTLRKMAYGGVLTFDAFGPHLRNSSALRTIDELRDRPESEWTDVARHFSYQYALFPNTSLTFDSRHIELWQIVPVDAHTSEVVHTSYLRPGLSDEERDKAAEMTPWICETVVDGEDFWVAGRTEPGVRLGMIDTVVFGRNEPAPQHLHRGFAAALEAARAVSSATDPGSVGQGTTA